jgi:hypothetical protein
MCWEYVGDADPLTKSAIPSLAVKGSKINRKLILSVPSKHSKKMDESQVAN